MTANRTFFMFVLGMALCTPACGKHAGLPTGEGGGKPGASGSNPKDDAAVGADAGDGGASTGNCVSSPSVNGQHYTIDTSTNPSESDPTPTWTLASTTTQWNCGLKLLTVTVSETDCGQNPADLARSIVLKVTQANISKLVATTALYGPQADPLELSVNRLGTEWGNCRVPNGSQTLPYGAISFSNGSQDADDAAWRVDFSSMLNLADCSNQASTLTLALEGILSFTLTQSYATACPTL